MASSEKIISHEENLRKVDHVRLNNDTISQNDTYRAQTEASNIQIVTPNYKSGEKPGSEVKIGTSVGDLNAKFTESNGDYKAERSQEHFRMQIIDPKVNSNAHLPAHAPREYLRKKLIEDFPSLHGKRSFLNLDAMQQRSVRNTQPITTSKYLTESVDRHRELENSDLKKYLKARENDANKPWNKPGWPGPKKDDESLIELDKLRQSLDTLQKAAREPRDPPPVVRTVVCQEPIRREVVEVRREVKPKVTQTVKRFEENKRTEEVERRIIRRERRHKSQRTRYSHSGSNHNHHDFNDWSNRGVRSDSAASRNGFGGHADSYQHYSSSRHGGDSASDRFFNQNRGSENLRFGSLSDSLRRGDLKYGPNGDLRENGGNSTYNSTKRAHRSYSTRDVFHENGNYQNGHSNHHSNGFNGGHQPFVEFPPTLPRHGALPPPLPPHRSNGFSSNGFPGSRRLTKSRSYADWDEGRGPFGGAIKRYDDDMSRLENEFRDSLLMKIPTNGGNMNEKNYRHEQIPGGYETYEREVKAHSGRKLNREGIPTNFNESSQDFNYKHETQR